MALKHGISKRYAAISWVLVALWACFIFFMSAHTSTDLSEGFFDQVKEFLKSVINSVIGYHEDPVSPFCHFCEYALFGLLLANALHCHMSWGRACLVALACASAYGVTDEFHQLFVPGRMSDPADWATDTCGAALGSLVYFALTTSRRRREQRATDKDNPAGHDNPVGQRDAARASEQVEGALKGGSSR